MANDLKTSAPNTPLKEEFEASFNHPPNILTSVVEGPLLPPTDPRSSMNLGAIWETLKDMFSDRHITLRKTDLTTAMLEGAATGIAFVGTIFFL